MPSAILFPDVVTGASTLVCAECGRAEGDGVDVIERYERRRPGVPVPDPRPVKALCTGCVDSLGLDWCCGCYEWMPAAEVDPETELCCPCELAGKGGRHE